MYCVWMVEGPLSSDSRKCTKLKGGKEISQNSLQILSLFPSQILYLYLQNTFTSLDEFLLSWIQRDGDIHFVFAHHINGPILRREEEMEQKNEKSKRVIFDEKEETKNEKSGVLGKIHQVCEIEE